MIVEGAIGMHQKMIKEYRGVPGVKAERIAEGMQVMIVDTAVCDTSPYFP